MNCPNDNNQMVQVQILSHYDRTLVLDQCSDCGGIWFDHMELYEAKQGQATKFEQVNLDKLAQIKKLNKPLHCPKDGTQLASLDTEHTIKNLDVELCPQCNGLWLDRGEFEDFQKAREKKVETKKIAKDKLSESIDALLRLHSSAYKYQEIANLGKHMMTPLVRTPVGFKAEAKNGISSDGSFKSDLPNNIAFSALNIILRALMRR